jgi:hypothetical protein
MKTEREIIEETPVGQWAFYGHCNPEHSRYRHDTFSVSIFRVWDKSGGRGKKRLPAVHRVSGSTSFPDVVYAHAQRIVDRLNADGVTDAETAAAIARSTKRNKS